jgi:hypothetical protein
MKQPWEPSIFGQSILQAMQKILCQRINKSLAEVDLKIFVYSRLGEAEPMVDYLAILIKALLN